MSEVRRMATFRLCLVDGCGKPYLATGYCNAHYIRLRKHGSPLGGGPQVTPRGEPFRFINEVVLAYDGNDCLTWPYTKSDKGYGQVGIDGKYVRATRYVCELVNGPPPTPDHEAAHSCGKGHEGCIAPGHLVWKTHTENMADKLIHDTHSRGERNGRAKLTEDEARIILSLKGVELQRETAERFGVSSGAVSAIHRGKNWAWLSFATKEIAA